MPTHEKFSSYAPAHLDYCALIWNPHFAKDINVYIGLGTKKGYQTYSIYFLTILWS